MKISLLVGTEHGVSGKTQYNNSQIRFMDTRLLEIQTPHYHGQFALSLGKESPLTFSLNSTPLIQTLSIFPLDR